jgi:hypothetical protein
MMPTSRFFSHQEALWQHLTQHWLRLVIPDEQANRSRWPMDPAWTLLHEHYGPVANAEPLDEESQVIVRGARYTGKSRLLRRMLLGVMDSLEVEDASPASASLATLQRWIERIAAKEEVRANARRERYLKRYGDVYTAIEAQHRSARRAVDRQGGQSHAYHPFDTGSDSRSLPQSSTRGAA